MTRNEKKTAIENMAERFMNISDLEGKSMAIMVMGCPAKVPHNIPLRVHHPFTDKDNRHI